MTKEASLPRLVSKGCPRCGGDLVRQSEGPEAEYGCLQCARPSWLRITEGVEPRPAVLMTPEERVAVAPLSPRLLETLRYVGQGMSNREVAAALRVTYAVAKHYIREVKDRLGIEDRQGLIDYWRGTGDVRPLTDS